MQHRVCLQLGNEPDAPVRWWRDGESAVAECATAEALAEVCAGEKAVLLAPASAAVTQQASLPAMPSQRLRQALPFALEEQFAGDVEQLHFAHGSRDSEGNVPVVAVEHARMQHWLEMAEQAQLQLQGVYHEALCLPWQEGSWTLLIEPHRGLLRTGPFSGYELPGMQLDILLQLAWEQRDATEVERLTVYDARGGEGLALPSLAGAAFESQECELPLELLCHGTEQSPIDLMQGPYSRREKLGRLWAPWRASALLLLALLLLQGGVAIYDYLRLSAEDETLYQETVALFREALPEVKNVVNPRVQMERRLQQLQSGGGVSPFTALMGGIGKALTGSEGVTVKGMRYRQGQLELELQLDTLPHLDKLKAQLEREKVSVEVRNATARGERVEASLLLSGVSR